MEILDQKIFDDYLSSIDYCQSRLHDNPMIAGSHWIYLDNPSKAGNVLIRRGYRVVEGKYNYRNVFKERVYNYYHHMMDARTFAFNGGAQFMYKLGHKVKQLNQI